jgi:decaprenyl-phosphate phosphoribosyltransferase
MSSLGRARRWLHGFIGRVAPLASASAGPAVAVSVADRRTRLQASLVTVRPRQWIKNALVIAAAAAAGALGHDDVPARVALACVAFCLLSSAALRD